MYECTTLSLSSVLSTVQSSGKKQRSSVRDTYQQDRTHLLAFFLPARHLSRLFLLRHTDFRRSMQWRRRASLTARRRRRERCRSRTRRRRERHDTRWPRRRLCVRPGSGAKCKRRRRIRQFSNGDGYWWRSWVFECTPRILVVRRRGFECVYKKEWNFA